jgi:hypothetical protein
MALAKEILERMGAKERHLKSVENSTSGTAKDGWKDIVIEEAESSIDQLVESSALIYASAFSEQDLKDILNFCDSPAGQKYFESSGMLEALLSRAGQNWTQQLLERSEERYQKEYYKRKAEEGIAFSKYIPPLNLKF